MAKGKKTGGNDWPPGYCPNPNGRPRVPEDLKKSRELNKIEFERILNKYIWLRGPEINAAIKSDEHPIIEGIIAKILAKAFNEGDTRRMDFVLDRLIGKPKEEAPRPPPADEKLELKSFEQFCIDASYPPPYPKQIEMMEFGMGETDPRLLLGSRGYGKTDYLTILGSAYDVYKNYFAGNFSSNLIITKSKSRNAAIIQEIAAALKSNGVSLEKENSSCIRVLGKTGKDHSFETITIKSSMRGRHPDRIIMDDPVTEEDVSEAMRVTVKNKYNEAMKLCNNILIIGQPAHAFDLYAELRPTLKKMEVPHGQIPQLDVNLDLLKIAGVDMHSIEMSYHLRVPASGMLIFGNIKYCDKFPKKDSVAFIDPSDGDNYTAASILTGYMDGIAAEGKVWRRAWYLCLDEMVPWLVARGVKKLCFETNKHGNQPLDQLRKLLAPYGIGVQGSYSDSNKHACIMSAGSYSHLIHLSKESDPVYTDQVVKYEYKPKFDDAPDSLARCLEWMGLIRGKKS